MSKELVQIREEIQRLDRKLDMILSALGPSKDDQIKELARQVSSGNKNALKEYNRQHRPGAKNIRT